ncbi:hypothetical protein LTR91_003141 [Friedmanniomyces endolithicus]|uniref:F-box domain-containing protein n=1 Tax=Friedmanniomyces endolithicus TaxID=329885 RepID=A0AAN6J7W6_9PEZI|nr:hypothetical protein LTS00_015994 [Friedmanniomyces endolithicus]KAK0274241.1 hypothetical protein LTR35_011750 [Friedmanniomyces endolithicus]KAK0311770.1 hypothetical protein LTR82_014142 [Friedmanniomyces endolithicus]KAK0902626.1 hypothetical protein LTR57_019562 [Friedmanniomyces endolithicus]KAK0983626.1 hypothetical protein LTR54_014291 [Friedmanniomyces endolithicus]
MAGEENAGEMATEHVTPMATNDSQIKPEAQDDSRTPKLFAIPPEVRNKIYELAFEGPSGEIDLLEARPPSKSLLRACRQMHEEAKGLHKSAHQRFWSTSRFVLYFRAETLQEPVGFSEQDLQNIRHLTCFLPSSELAYATLGKIRAMPRHNLQEPTFAYRRLPGEKWSCFILGGLPIQPGFEHVLLLKGNKPIGSRIIWNSGGVANSGAFGAITKEEIDMLVGYSLRLRET